MRHSIVLKRLEQERLLPRFRRAQQDAKQAAKLAEVLLETGDPLPAPEASLTFVPGDPAAMRGLPAVGVRGGFGGAIAGTRPGVSPALDAWSPRSLERELPPSGDRDDVR